MIRSWLIARGTFREKLAVDGNIDHLVDQDYMGSAEFEFGSKRESLDACMPVIEEYQLFKAPFKKPMGKHEASLFVLCRPADKDEVFARIAFLAENKLRLQEPTYFRESLENEGPGINIDFWWDIKNHFFFGFGKERMTKVRNTLKLRKHYKELNYL